MLFCNEVSSGIQRFTLKINKLLSCPSDNPWDDILMLDFNAFQKHHKLKKWQWLCCCWKKQQISKLCTLQCQSWFDRGNISSETHYHLCKISCWSIEYIRYCTCSVQISNIKNLFFGSIPRETFSFCSSRKKGESLPNLIFAKFGFTRKQYS